MHTCMCTHTHMHTHPLSHYPSLPSLSPVHPHPPFLFECKFVVSRIANLKFSWTLIVFLSFLEYSGKRPPFFSDHYLLKPFSLSKHIIGSEERYLLRRNTTCKFWGYSPLSSYKMTPKQQLNVVVFKWWKIRWQAKSLICFCLVQCFLFVFY